MLRKQKTQNITVLFQPQKQTLTSILPGGSGVWFGFHWCYELLNDLSSTLKLSTQGEIGSSGKYSTQLSHKRCNQQQYVFLGTTFP